jgi:DNA-binding beta-propeller fold protein YncE
MARARNLFARLFFLPLVLLAAVPALTSAQAEMEPSHFRVDASWPKPLPNNWIIGQVSGMATDSEDHIWVLQRPLSLTDDERGATFNPPLSNCCSPAPPVLEFDVEGRLLRSWGGPGQGYDWPQNEHGIFIDAEGNVWITGNGEQDGQVLKFKPDGTFLMQIGKVGPQTGDADITRLGQPAGIAVDIAANEVYVADGYFNHRIIVFDAKTGAFHRKWGAYGKSPDDSDKPNLRRTAPPTAAQLTHFGNPVHCVRIANDGLVYVCDRLNDRIQIFKKDGTFVKEFSIEPRTAGNGSVWDIAFSRDPEQRWLYIADGRNNQILTVSRMTGEVRSSTGGPGRNAGYFHWVHDMAIDGSGNIYTGEVDTGKRIQKFAVQH